MRLLHKFARLWYIYLLVLIALPVAAVFFGKQRLSEYQSFAYLLVSRQPYITSLSTSNDITYLTPAQNEANFLNELIQSQSFCVKVAQDSDLAKVYDLSTQSGQVAVAQRIQASIEVTVAAGPSALTIMVRDKNPVIAQQLANGVIKQFAIYDAGQSLQLDQQAETFYQKQLDQAVTDQNKDIDAIQAYARANPGVRVDGAATDPTVQKLQNQLKIDSDRVTSFQTTLAAIRIDMEAAQSGISNNLKVQDAPSLPQKPTVQSKQLIVYGAGGLTLAVVLVGLAVWLQALFDRKLYTADDVTTVFDELDRDVPIIETVPPVGGKRSRGNGSDAQSPVARMLVPWAAPAGSGAPNNRPEMAVDAEWEDRG